MRKDKYWHQAVVVEQHPSGIGTELLFDNGETDLIDLNTVGGGVAFNLQTQDEESEFLTQVGRLVRGLRPRSPAVPRALVLGQAIAPALWTQARVDALMCA